MLFLYRLNQWYFRETEKVDREALYCSSALHKMRQNVFHQRLTEHQTRWVKLLSFPSQTPILSLLAIFDLNWRTRIIITETNNRSKRDRKTIVHVFVK